MRVVVPLAAGLVAATVVLAAAATPAPAQEQPVLTLEEALSRAAEHSPAYRRARNEMGLSGPAKRAAWGAFLPSLQLSAGTGLSFNRRLRSTDNFGNPIENPVTDWRTTSSSNQRVGGEITLFQGGSRFHELSAAGAEAEARAAAARASLLEVEAEVARRYWDAARARALLEVEEELLAGRERDLETTRRRYELAGLTRVDLLAAEQSLREQEQALREARSTYDKARLTLERTIGDRSMGPFRVETPVGDDIVPVRERAGAEGALPGLPPEDTLVARALARNPRVIRDRAGVDAAEAAAAAAGGSRWPTISLNYGLTQNTFDEQRSALFDAYPDDSRFVSTGLSLSIPVFSNFQIQHRTAQADVASDNAREMLRQTRLQVEEEVRSRLIDVRTAREGLRIARQARELATERLELAREQYRQGTRSFTDLQRDIEAAVGARRQATTALYDYLIARANLAEVVGADMVEEAGADSGDPGGD